MVAVGWVSKLELWSEALSSAQPAGRSQGIPWITRGQSRGWEPTLPWVSPPARAASPSMQGSSVAPGTGGGRCQGLWHCPFPAAPGNGHSRHWELPGAPADSRVAQSAPPRFINILCLPGCKIPTREGGRGGRGASSPSAAAWGALLRTPLWAPRLLSSVAPCSAHGKGGGVSSLALPPEGL